MLSYSYLSGFSVAFGSTGCSGSAGGRAPFAPLARTLSAGGTNSYGRPETCPPREICKIGVSKMQFAALPGPELGNRNFDRNHLFFFPIVCIT